MALRLPGHADEAPCSPQDTRIMLRMLLTEALRYHRNRSGFSMDAWQLLQRQIEDAWDFSDLPAAERYLRLKYRLTTLFLWDRDHDIERDLEEPPTTIMSAFSREQVRRLETLPPGQLFHSPGTPPGRAPCVTGSGGARLVRDGDYPRTALHL